MHRIQTILVATDYSEQARGAETRAAMLSVELKATTLEILAVQETRMGLNTPATASQSTGLDVAAIDRVLVENRLPVSLSQSVETLQCVRSLAVGKPASAIARRADEMGADLTIVAARSKKFVPDYFTRDDNDELVRLCTRPVLLVHTDPERAYAKVLVAVDFSEESKEVARYALAVAPSAHFTFLHACVVPGEGIMRVQAQYRSHELEQDGHVRKGTRGTQSVYFPTGAKETIDHSCHSLWAHSTCTV
jgi:nucleotide-binding universal stress UspA family protein